MNPVIIIPARLGSTRLPNKMLVEVGGKPLIRWTAEAAMRTGLPVYVATGDEPIIDAVRDLEGKGCGYVLTGPCLNGTERCIEALYRVGDANYDLLVNWQGDSPLTDPEHVTRLVEHMATSPFAVGTLHAFAGRSAHGGEVNVNHLRGVALFQRTDDWVVDRHIGVYAIKADAWPLYGRVPSHLEMLEDLEQCRWRERGVAVTSLEVIEDVHSFEINTGTDLAAFSEAIEARHAAV